MALVKCPDCKRDVSDLATTCLGCGRPIAGVQSSAATRPEVSKEKTSNVVLCRLAGCKNEASSRCNTCSNVYCIQHIIVRTTNIGGVSYECDVCSRKRSDEMARHLEDDRIAWERIRANNLKVNIVAAVVIAIISVYIGSSDGNWLNGLIVFILGMVVWQLPRYLFFS